MKLTTAREDLITTYFKDECLLALPSYANHIFQTPIYFASAQDFAAKVQEVYNEKTYKVFYLMFNFARFDDDPTKGCDDDPLTYVTYRWQLFRETQEARNNKPNSHDSLVNDMITLRNYFLKNRDVVVNQITHRGLVQVGDMITVQNSDYVNGVLGDWINLRITVEINK